MAEKRMISKTVVDSDDFLDLPVSSQNLYFHLNIRADDEGFVNSPNKIMRMVGCNKNDLDCLLAKRFILSFESGVIVIKHWKIHNYIRKDRIKKTVHTEEKATLYLKENNSYTLEEPIKKIEMSGKCQASDGQTSDECQDRLDKVSIDKNSIDKYSVELADATVLEITEKQIQKLLERYKNVDIRSYCNRIEDYCESKNKTYKDLYKVLNSWISKDVLANKLVTVPTKGNTEDISKTTNGEEVFF